MPALPATALASVPKPSDGSQAGNGAIIPIPTHKGPTLATPAVRSTDTPAAEDASGTRRQVPGKYGHGPDYTWLQGELDRLAQRLHTDGRPSYQAHVHQLGEILSGE